MVCHEGKAVAHRMKAVQMQSAETKGGTIPLHGCTNRRGENFVSVGNFFSMLGSWRVNSPAGLAVFRLQQKMIEWGGERAEEQSKFGAYRL